jgi:O-Antigen ligase
MTFILNRWLALALYVSTGPILVFAHGFAGAGSLFTAAFMAGSTLALLLSSRWGNFTIDPCDLLFGMFICCIIVSFMVNGIHSDPKEITLLVLSLVAYPSARSFAGSKAIAPSFVLFTAAVVIVGAALAVVALPEQWSNSYGRPHPVVFGQFGAAPLQFTLSLGFLMIALVCMQLTTVQATAAGVLMFLLTAVFAASFVRFSFVAIGAALLFALLTSPRHDRKFVATMICLMIFGVIIGNIARVELAPRFSSSVSAAAPGQAVPSSLILISADESVGPLSKSGENAPHKQTCPIIDLQDSIAIRKQLYSDAFAVLPSAGPFGVGMDHFMSMSCIKDSQIHNTILQAAVELGWITAAVLVALLIFAGLSLWRSARYTADARFALCGLIFVATLAMGHGRVSRDSLLFLFLGYVAGVRALLAHPIRLSGNERGASEN